MNINWDSILGKYKDYINSTSFKQKVNSSSGGGFVISPQIMEEAGMKMAAIITECALSSMSSAYGSSSIPSSISSLLTSGVGITSTPYEFGINAQGFTKYQLDVGFLDDEDLHRPALRWKNGKSPYDGIDNIISLYDTGYYARNHAYGYNRHDVFTVSQTHYFDGMAFMSAAVETFNDRYGNEYNCHAYISADPQFYVRR